MHASNYHLFTIPLHGINKKLKLTGCISYHAIWFYPTVFSFIFVVHQSTGYYTMTTKRQTAVNPVIAKAQYTPPTRRNCRVASRRRWRCEHKFATSSRRLPMDSAMWTQLLDTGTRIVAKMPLVYLLNLQTKQTPMQLMGIFIRKFLHVNTWICITFSREADTIPTDSVPTDAIPTICSQDDPVHL